MQLNRRTTSVPSVPGNLLSRSLNPAQQEDRGGNGGEGEAQPDDGQESQGDQVVVDDNTVQETQPNVGRRVENVSQE